MNIQSGLLSLFERDLVAQLAPVQFKGADKHLAIQGFLPSPESDPTVVSKTNNDKCFLYVNQRPIIQKDVVSLVSSKFCAFMVEKDKMVSGSRRYPFIFLDIMLPPHEYDSKSMFHD